MKTTANTKKKKKSLTTIQLTVESLGLFIQPSLNKGGLQTLDLHPSVTRRATSLPCDTRVGTKEDHRAGLVEHLLYLECG